MTISPISRLVALQTSVAMALCLSAGSAMADTRRCDDALLPQPDDCRRANGEVVVEMPVGENAEEIKSRLGAGFPQTGFSISIDGDTVAGAKAPQNPERDTDIAASAANVDVRFDGFGKRPMLNVSTTDLRSSYQAGATISFQTSANYPAWIARAEVVVIDRAARGRPIVATLPAPTNGTVDWVMPADGSGDYAYILRVFDSAGRRDETVAFDLGRSTKAFDTHETTGTVTAAGVGEDRTRLRTIPARGGMITVSGTGAGRTVTVMGETVPVDPSGNFVISRVLPAGDHVVTVESNGQTLRRDVNIPPSEWFYVGLVDLTYEHKLRDDAAEADPDYTPNSLDGRLAGYAKGQTKDGYTITGSIDTGEGALKDAFRRLNDKDPRRVIQRLDPTDLYPTYGDDSSAYDDAPTSGRAYLRIERDASSLTFGDFKSNISNTEFLSQQRALYGAELRYETPSVTQNGDPRASVSLYAAQPDTLPQRDVLRGTGGSIYFLSRQDLNGGSETIRVETVDPVTGRVLSRRTLSEGVDYEIDYIQGVVILARPLGSSAGDGGLITTGSGPNDVNLVAQYEYTPTAGSLDGASFGGRAEVWATDQLRLGITASSDATGTADQITGGVDLRYEIGTQSYVEAEVAQTKGPGFGRAFSTDGGLTIDQDGIVDAPRALAYRLDSRLEFADLGLSRPGFIGFYTERKENGFSTLTEDITANQTLVGINSSVDVTDRLTFALDAEKFRSDTGERKDTAELRFAYKLSDVWTVEAGAQLLNQVVLGKPQDTGRRTDVGARLTYQQSDDLKLYGFGQVTADVSGGIGKNDRLGFGFDARVSEKVTVAGEISGGSKGTGGLVKVSYAPTADNEVYLGYTFDPTRTGAGYDLVGRDDGTIVVGGKYRYSEKLTSYGEQNWDLFGDRRSLTKAYGVTYTPDARWTLSGGFETGEVRDTLNGNFDRDAISLGAAYTSEDAASGRMRLEYRTEDGVGTAQDRDTWGLTGGYEYKVNDNWRFLANVDALYSQSAEADFRNGEYVEASLGYAYRPVLDDRLNLLLRYSYLRDLPGEGQVTADGTTNGPLQISHIFSIDGNYDIGPKWTIGAKYGYRSSEVSTRGTGVFTDSTAHLGILRADWHLTHKWDALLEGRALFTEESDTTEAGGLLALYRHVGNNFQVGLGYEIGTVSDDLADIDYTGRGIFLNVIGKF